MREAPTKEIRRLLRWLDENPCTQAEWLTDGKTAKGGPEKWNQHRCSGAGGSIVVSAETWFAAKDYFEVNPTLRPSMWRLTEAGRALLQIEERKAGGEGR
jgi:hypothetical protein